MASKTLPVEPYNDYFFHCVTNNLLGILVSRNERFRDLALMMKANYSICHPHNMEIFSELSVEKFQDVWFVLQMEYPNSHVRSLMSHWFECEEFYVTGESIHEVIQDYLQRNYYIFIEIDRYYMPNGTDYMKKSRVHPTFIYGYNDHEEKYELMEDCIRLGSFSPYEIHMRDFDKAFKSAQETTTPFFQAFRLKGLEGDWKPTKEILRDNVLHLLEEREEHQETEIFGIKVTKHSGLSCIKRFSEHLNLSFPRIAFEEVELFKALTLPSQHQEKNRVILQRLMDDNQIAGSTASLLQNFTLLRDEWASYRNLMLKFVIQKTQNPNFTAREGFFDKIKAVLHRLYDLELEINIKLLSVLKMEK